MRSQDTVLILGNEDSKLEGFLGKLGYSLFKYDGKHPLPEVLSRQVIDVLIVDARLDFDCFSLCQYLRSDECTRKVPLIYIGNNKSEINAIKALGYDRIEFLEPPLSPGLVMSRIATQLRLRKLSGLDERKASIIDVLAAQKDLTSKFTKELDEARSIQLSLLPRALPQDERFEIIAHYRPLDEVGGDWYYMSTEAPDKLVLQIADVTGHGLSAALVGSMTRLAFYASPRSTPENHLGEMNRLMTPQLPEGRFVTVASCFYNPATGDVQCARAGHPPVLILRHKVSQVEKLQPDGFAVGFFEDAVYSGEQAALEVGDSLVLYSDGFTEAQNRSFELFGEERLAEALAAGSSCQTAQAVLEQIIKGFETFIDGRRLKDDVTLIVLRRSK